MNRKQRRALGKQLGDETTSTVDLMLSMPRECLTCNKLYDKLSKEMAMSWFVEVFKADKKINLYCPECYNQKTPEIKND